MGLRVLVVDDTVVFRRAISDALTGVPGVEVVGTAANGKLALSRMAALQPDLITLDIEMPEMNGLEVLEAMGPAGLKAGVIVLSAFTLRGGEMTLRALELGAFDFVTKPHCDSAVANRESLREYLLPMIRAFERHRQIRTMLRTPAVRPTLIDGPSSAALSSSSPNRTGRRISHVSSPLVLIGVSTGGPAALTKLLPALPSDLGAPVFIVQHMPALFTQSLADSLARKCGIRIKEAQDGDVAQVNRAYLAPGGRQMKLMPGPRGEIVVRITDDPPENHCRPAVDYLFRSAALNFPGRSIAAILTGMGNDGTAGLRMLKQGGCTSIAQDEASCVVFGMPREAILAGLVDSVVPLDKIAAAIVHGLREARA